MTETENYGFSKPELSDTANIEVLNQAFDQVDAVIKAEEDAREASDSELRNDMTRTAAVVIAASDASEKSKAAADYVCTGTNDHVKINAAIQSLASCGGRVVLSEGTFVFPLSSTVNIPQGVTLIGQGKGTVIKRQTGSSGAGNNMFVIPDTSKDACLSDFVIRIVHSGNSITADSPRIVYVKGHHACLRNLDVIHTGVIATGYLCYIDGNYNTVENCTFAAADGADDVSPFEVYGNYNTISGCLIVGGGMNDEILIAGYGNTFIHNRIDIEAVNILYGGTVPSSDYFGSTSTGWSGSTYIISGNYFRVRHLSIEGSNLVMTNNIIETENSVEISCSNLLFENNLIKLTKSTELGKVPYAAYFLGTTSYCCIRNNMAVRLVPDGMAAGTYPISIGSPPSSSTGSKVENNIYVPAVVESEEA